MIKYPTQRVSTECECHDSHHQMEFTLFEWDTDPEDAEFFISVQLNQKHNFFMRCWVALKYVLGRRSRYSWGQWDEGTISVDGAKELLPMIQRFIDTREKRIFPRPVIQQKEE